MHEATESDRYPCKACEKRFGSKVALERHVFDVGLVD